ncbi:hypothetical protein BV898_19807 [Hypsibius exemplaris]|uniref:Uncharacterized protein n=1 Tax=Hypsibius exemplaris TaxID=2072580 RepID=A0A9X6NJR2_HYPEX|nr:hypothetical protein BV898_19807 [Hypsibius exemplaris]
MGLPCSVNSSDLEILSPLCEDIAISKLEATPKHLTYFPGSIMVIPSILVYMIIRIRDRPAVEVPVTVRAITTSHLLVLVAPVVEKPGNGSDVLRSTMIGYYIIWRQERSAGKQTVHRPNVG